MKIKNLKLNKNAAKGIVAGLLAGVIATTSMVGVIRKNNNESILSNTYVVDLGDRKDIAIIVDECMDVPRYKSLITGEIYTSSKCTHYEYDGFTHQYDFGGSVLFGGDVGSLSQYLTDIEENEYLSGELSQEELIGIIARIVAEPAKDKTL